MFTYTDPRDALGDVQTPPYVSNFLHRLLKHLKPKTVLDPSMGFGNLILPWHPKAKCIGIEKERKFLIDADVRLAGMQILHQTFESTTREQLESIPDLVMCNPPWNRHWKNLNYPEVFLRKIVELFGPNIPICFLCPMGFRLNQRVGSKRVNWLRSSELQITSIISCPIDMYPNTEFHSEIILFNVRRVKPHYWMVEEPES